MAEAGAPEPTLEALGEAAQQRDEPRHVALAEQSGPSVVHRVGHGATHAQRVPRGRRQRDQRSPAIRGVRSTPDEPAFVLYTSGSSGQPKGVVLRHENVLGNARNAHRRRGIVADDRIWLGSPLFYGLGATNVLPMAMTAGATLVIQDRFSPEGALTAIEPRA